MSALPQLKKPEEWEREFGIKILDPDGWRREGIAWDFLISCEKFEKLAAVSTVKLLKVVEEKK